VLRTALTQITLRAEHDREALCRSGPQPDGRRTKTKNGTDTGPTVPRVGDCSKYESAVGARNGHSRIARDIGPDQV